MNILFLLDYKKDQHIKQGYIFLGLISMDERVSRYLLYRETRPPTLALRRSFFLATVYHMYSKKSFLPFPVCKGRGYSNIYRVT